MVTNFHSVITKVARASTVATISDYKKGKVLVYCTRRSAKLECRLLQFWADFGNNRRMETSTYVRYNHESHWAQSTWYRNSIPRPQSMHMVSVYFLFFTVQFMYALESSVRRVCIRTHTPQYSMHTYYVCSYVHNNRTIIYLFTREGVLSIILVLSTEYKSSIEQQTSDDIRDPWRVHVSILRRELRTFQMIHATGVLEYWSSDSSYSECM